MTPTPPPELCFHCASPNPAASPYRVRWRGQDHACCCAGCQAVASMIIEQGLDRYYEQRTALPSAVAPVPAELQARMALYGRPEVAAQVLVETEQSQEVCLLIEGATCPACLWLTEQQLRRVPGVLEVQMHYGTNRARVRWARAGTQTSGPSLNLPAILQAVHALGYRAEPYDVEVQLQQQTQQRRQALFRLGVAGLGMMQVMMYAIPSYIASAGSMTWDQTQLMRWASALLTLPVVSYASGPFYRQAWQALRHGRLSMDLPIALGIILGFGASVYVTWRGHGEVYFDSISMLVFLLLGARYLELLARLKAEDALTGMRRLWPTFCHRLPDYPQSRHSDEATVASLQVGDHIMLRPGETVPVDGRVVEGHSSHDEAFLTGESLPVSKPVGSWAHSGAINQHAPQIIQVQAVGEHTLLAGMLRLVDHALADKPAYTWLVDRLAARFTWMVLFLAAVSAALWAWMAPERALGITVAVLVVSCPCALALATPVALTRALGLLCRQGIWVRRGRALERWPEITDVVFDKTGTLTLGELHCTGVHLAPETGADTALPGSALALALALEQGSEHPLARALRRWSETHAPSLANTSSSVWPLQELHNTPGWGVQGLWNQHGQTLACRLGRFEFVQAQGAPDKVPSAIRPTPAWAPAASPGCTRIWLGLHDATGASRCLAAFDFQDQARSDSAQVVQQLQQQGLTVHLASGDQSEAVAYWAQHWGITQAHSRMLPADKLALVQSLQAQGRKVCMVGDGINDAAVLAAAEVAIAMGQGTALAQSQADAVLTGQQLGGLLTLRDMAQATRRIIRQNLVWAAVYNLGAIPLATLGWINPWMSGLGMASSSLLVVLNTLRLGTKPRGRPNSAAKDAH